MESIYDVERGECFLRKVSEYERLLWYAAKHYEIPGVLLPEDLYQEGLMALEETFDHHWMEDPDDECFTRSFKSRLFHRMHEVLRPYKAQKRDWRKELRATINYEGIVEDVIEGVPQATFPPPDHGLKIRDMNNYLDAIRDSLTEASINGPLLGSYDDDALELLDIILDPDFEIPDTLEMFYERPPTKGISNTILAEITGWNIMRVRRVMKRLRKHVLKFAEKYSVKITNRHDTV